MGMKLLRGGRSSRKDTNNNKQDTLPTTRIEHESLSTHGDSSHPVVTPPHALDHVREDDDVSSIHFGESVSSPTYCYTQAPPQSRRTPRFLATPPPLKFVRSDSHVMNHERPTAVSPTSRGSATPPIDNTTRSSPALTSLLYLSLVTFELKNTTSGKHVVRETLQRHVYTSVEDELFHTTTARRKSVPVDVDNCDFVQEDEGVYEEMAMRHLQRRDVPAAMNVYQTLVSSSGNKFQQSQLYSQLSVLYVLHGNRQKAVWSSERSLAIYRKEGLAQEQVTSLLEMGVMLLYSQKPNDALRKFRQAFQLECKLVGYHHSSIPLLLNNMAVAHVVLGDSDESFILLKESLELQRNAQQTNLESLKQMGITLLNLGIVSSKRKAHIEATSYFEEGLMVMESILGVDNAFVQLCSTTLEELIVQRNSFTGSPPKRVKMPVFGNADGIPIGALHHPVDVIVMGSLQHELTLEQRVRNAVTSTFRSSMLGVVERKPPKSVPIDVDGDRVLDAELHLSGIHSLVLQHTRRNEIDEALELLRSTLRSHKTKYGQVHHLVGTALHNIALVNLFAGRYKDAEWYFQEAVSVRIAALGTDHPDISTSMLKLGMIQMANDNLDSAYATFTQVLDTRRKSIGHQQPEVAKILNLVGYVQYEFGSLLAALKLMEEALEIQRHCPECDEDMADTLANMGFLYAKSKDYPEAVTVLREAVALQRRVLSDSHPRTIVTRQNLKLVYAFKSKSIAFQTMDPCIDSTLEMNNCHALGSFTPQWNED